MTSLTIWLMLWMGLISVEILEAVTVACERVLPSSGGRIGRLVLTRADRECAQTRDAVLQVRRAWQDGVTVLVVPDAPEESCGGSLAHPFLPRRRVNAESLMDSHLDP